MTIKIGPLANAVMQGIERARVYKLTSHTDDTRRVYEIDFVYFAKEQTWNGHYYNHDVLDVYLRDALR